MALKVKDTTGVVNMYADLENATAPMSAPDLTSAPKNISRPKILQVIRYLSRANQTNPEVGLAFAVADVNFYLSEKINEGYRLFATHYLGENPEGYGMLYVLVSE